MSDTVQLDPPSIRLDRSWGATACAVANCRRPLGLWFQMPHGMLSLCTHHGDQFFTRGVIAPEKAP